MLILVLDDIGLAFLYLTLRGLKAKKKRKAYNKLKILKHIALAPIIFCFSLFDRLIICQLAILMLLRNPKINILCCY
jgi:hypothetical protein